MLLLHFSAATRPAVEQGYHLSNCPNFRDRLSLPCTISSQSAAPIPVIEEDCLAGCRILIVDDNATNRQLLLGLLGRWGCKVDSVDGGPGALEQLEHAAATGTAYDILLLDMQMPGMDGETLGRTVRADPRFAAIPLVMLTSATLRGDAERLRQAGFAAYLSKPINADSLEDVLQHYIRPVPVRP
jgi:CheY-like chemotaxis protein